MSFIELKSIESAFICVVDNDKRINSFYKEKISRYDDQLRKSYYMIRRNARRQDSTMNMDFIFLFEIYIIGGRKSLWLLGMTYNKMSKKM